MASRRLSFLNFILRWLVKPRLMLNRDPKTARREMARAARFVFRSPPYVLDLPEADVEWVSVGTCHPRKVILYFHGGGYVAGSPATHRAMMARLSRLSGLRVALPRYRLAPEHPAPAAFEDACRAYDTLLARGIAPGDIILGGDSAGGGLALALLAHLTREGRAPVAGFFLSPWTDLTLSGASLTRNAKRDVLLPVRRIEELVRLVKGQCAPNDPRLSPLFAQFEAPPPVMIHASKSEVLWDDSRRMAERLRDCGGRVILQAEENAPHVWPVFDGYIPEARATLREIAIFLKPFI